MKINYPAVIVAAIAHWILGAVWYGVFTKQFVALMEWTPEKFLKEASAIHPEVELYIAQVLQKKSHPEQAYRSCNGILSFAKRKSNDVLISACQHAHHLGRYSFKAIEEIILGGLDKLDWKEQESYEMPKHENIRG